MPDSRDILIAAADISGGRRFELSPKTFARKVYHINAAGFEAVGRCVVSFGDPCMPANI